MQNDRPGLGRRLGRALGVLVSFLAGGLLVGLALAFESALIGWFCEDVLQVADYDTVATWAMLGQCIVVLIVFVPMLISSLIEAVRSGEVPAG